MSRTRSAEYAHDLPGVQPAQVLQSCLQVESGGASFQHAVGEQHQAVAGLQLDLGRPVGLVAQHPEGPIDGQRHGLRGSVAYQQRGGVPGVDDGEDPGAQVQPADNPGDERETGPGRCR